MRTRGRRGSRRRSARRRRRRACPRPPESPPTRRSSRGSRPGRRARPSRGAAPTSCRRSCTPARSSRRAPAAPRPRRRRRHGGGSCRTPRSARGRSARRRAARRARAPSGSKTGTRPRSGGRRARRGDARRAASRARTASSPAPASRRAGWRRRARRRSRDLRGGRLHRHGVEPLAVALGAAVERVLERALDGARDLAGVALADRMVVDLAQRRELGGRAGDEHLVGEVELGAGDVALDHLKAEVVRDLDDRLAVDAVEDRGRLRRREDPPVAHDEDVLARALADLALVVEEDGLLVAGLVRLDLREHRVEVLAGGLRVRDQRVRADPPPRGDLRPDAVALALVAEVGAPLPAGDRHVDRRVEREEAHRAVAAVGDRADVAGAHAVAGDEVERGLADLRPVVRHRHVVELGRLEQAVDVVEVAEDRRPDLGVVAADALEDARAVVEPVREYVNLRVLPLDELAVHPDEVRLLHVDAPYRRCPSTARVASAVVAVPPRSWVRSPSSSARSTADSRAAASVSKPSPCRSIIAPDRNMARGLATPRPAMSGAEPCTGSNIPGVPGAPSDALGSLPSEPVSIADSSLRMSPNMLSVRITSKCVGAATSCIAALSTSTCSSAASGNSSAWTRLTVSRQSREVSSTLALSTLETRRRAARNAIRAMRSISPVV